MSLTFCKQILMISKLIRRKELGGETDQPPSQAENFLYFLTTLMDMPSALISLKVVSRSLSFLIVSR